MTVSFGDYVEIAAPSRDGYEFLGWTAIGLDTLTAEYGNTSKTIQRWTNSSTKVTAQYFRNLRSTEGTVTLTAQWSVTSYGISYDLAGGNFGTYHPESAEYDETVIISNPTQEGYVFSGWTASNLSTSTAKYGTTESTDSSWSDSLAAVSSEYFSNLQQGAETVTLYATWDGNPYTVVFNGNGATSGSMANQSFVYGTYQNLTANAYSRTGYTFMGWSRSRTAVRPTYTDGQSVRNLTTGSTITLYAVWDANEYTLTFNANGGTVSPSSITVSYGQTYGYYLGGSLPVPTRIGYLFSGWTTTRTGNFSTDERFAFDTYDIAGDSTLYARWQETWYSSRSSPNGRGTYANPYVIESSRNLGWLTYRVANGYDTNAYCVQTNNIDTITDAIGSGSIIEYLWYPIGTSSSPFSGNYDGGGCSLDLLMGGSRYDEVDYQTYTGMFGYLSRATVSGLYLMTNSIQGSMYTGGVAGYASNSTITGCALYTGELSSNTSTRGAIIGYGNSSTTIRDCTVFEASSSSGSLGLASGSVSVSNCVYIINDRKGYTGSDFSNFVFVDNMKAPLPKGISWLAEGGEPATLSQVRSWANS